ncbi:LXG domain of WXG superfamily protein [Pseudobutyrivibrio sp. YE44]|uniref:T7SS effector LXG polymorphic toxin n=1 Tax=Pseudobutyrivibrio sp. YE44 TaxID=1520802 RepID=UPI00087F6A51|nr:T7SS effector LXG polymorphic toxin [Pseudobutyrivibrio sp. YE44]SDB40096.1 LXG domain of WXG superfamily protein [Pseudobutyrivibrio sp. YE44]
MQGKDYNVSFIDNLSVYTLACQRIAEIQNILATVQSDVTAIIDTNTFTGVAADNIKAYAKEIHLPLISSVSLMLSEYQAKLMLYYSEYFGIDSDYAAKFCAETMDTYRGKALKYDSANALVKQDIADSISKVSDIILLANPSLGTLSMDLQGMASMIDNIDTWICDYEQEHSTDLDSLTEFISNLEVFITYYRDNVNPNQYHSGDCLNNTYAQTLRESMIFSQEYLQNNQDRLNAASENINAIAERMQADYDAAVQARIDEGRAKLIMGIGVAIIGGIAIVASAGAATPAVAGALMLTGTCTMGYGIANAEEGAQDIYYGMHGDLSSYAFNPIRDTIFMGNQELYDLWGNANMLAANVLTMGSTAYLSAASKGLQGMEIGKSVAVSVSKELMLNKMGDVATDMTVNLIDQHVGINQTERAILSIGIGALTDPGTYEAAGKIGGKLNKGHNAAIKIDGDGVHDLSGESVKNESFVSPEKITSKQLIQQRTEGLDLEPHRCSNKQLSSSKMKEIKQKIDNRTATREEYNSYNWNKKIRQRRSEGVKEFWNQERERILNNEPTTRDWNSEQKDAIINGKTPQYDGKPISGHHTYSVSEYPHLANRGEVIFPATQNEHLNGWHGGNYRNSLPGEPIVDISDF